MVKIKFLTQDMNVLYSINAKKEPAGIDSPELAAVDADSLTGSTITISNLLDRVNRYYPDILPAWLGFKTQMWQIQELLC